MKEREIFIAVATILFGVIIVTQSFYILNQTNQSIELRFGKTIALQTTPGLKFKMPFLDEVKIFDNRLINLSCETKEVIAADKKRLIVDAFAKYQIIDSLKFYQSVRDENGAATKLNSILESSMRQVIGSVPFNSLLQAGIRADVMEKIRKIVDEKALSFGVTIKDVRIMRADLPEENSVAVFRRMQTEREREAREFRAEGEEEAKKISAKADREQTEILANAKKSSSIIRGEADASATKIFAQSFGKDPQFYEFLKSMEVYKNSIANDKTNLVISPDNKFLKHFK